MKRYIAEEVEEDREEKTRDSNKPIRLWNRALKCICFLLAIATVVSHTGNVEGALDGCLFLLAAIFFQREEHQLEAGVNNN